MSNGIRHTYKFVKKFIEDEGFQLISNTYKNSHTKMIFKCPKGHEYESIFTNFQKGSRCAKCSNIKKLTYKYVKKYIEKEGYQLLSEEYKNALSKLKIKCPKGHEYKVTWNNFQRGKRCSICNRNKKTSKAEKELLYYIKKYYKGVVIPNHRGEIINPETGWNLEFDVWLPEVKKAIEFNGAYWHSFYKVKRKDKIKKQQCKEKGINLMVIQEQKWTVNREKCLNDIREFIDE